MSASHVGQASWGQELARLLCFPRHWSALAHKAARAGTCDSLRATVAGAPVESLSASAPSLSQAPGMCGRCPGACRLAARPGKASGLHSAATPARSCVRVQPGTSASSTVAKHAHVGVALCCTLPHCCVPCRTPYLRCAIDSCAQTRAIGASSQQLSLCSPQTLQAGSGPAAAPGHCCETCLSRPSFNRQWQRRRALWATMVRCMRPLSWCLVSARTLRRYTLLIQRGLGMFAARLLAVLWAAGRRCQTAVAARLLRHPLHSARRTSP